jgi:hypothetical protein
MLDRDYFAFAYRDVRISRVGSATFWGVVIGSNDVVVVDFDELRLCS